MGDVFLLGAGFSKAVAESMPVLADLGEEIQDRLPPGSARDCTPPPRGPFEMWLTYLSQPHPWISEADNLRNRALFLEVSRAVAEVMEERTREVVRGECPAWLTGLVEWWHERRAGIATLNYDTLVERVARGIELEEEGIRGLHCSDIYPAGLTPAALRVGGRLRVQPVPSFQLYKLHGSINWFYSGASSFFGELIYYVELFGGWRAPDDEREAIYAEGMSDKVPLMVPPVTEKVAYFQHETLRSLWARAAAALREADRVFCLGYSLPPSDITMRFFLQGNCPRRRVKFYLATPDEKVVARFRSVLPGAYELDERFVGPDPIPELSRALLAGALDAARS